MIIGTSSAGEGESVARVFLSYASGDLRWAEEVHAWLTADGHVVFFDRHERDGIPPGRDWKQCLYSELSRVDAVVSLVTTRYRSSMWCVAEVSIAGARGCPIIPLRGEPDIEFRLIDELQHSSADADKARVQALAELRSLDGNTGWRDGDNPYPGLAPFSTDMSGLFFGRGAETRELAAAVRASASERVIAVTGPSGSGKSSLLRAGLLPHLTKDWLVVGPFTPEDSPTYALAKAVTAVARGLGLGWPLDDVEQRLAHPEGLRRATDELIIAVPHAQRVLVAVDQGEDLFAAGVSDAERAGFAALIKSGLSGAARVVMTVRSEYDAELSLLGRVTPFRVGPLDRAMVRAAVEEPARIAGLKLPPGLTDRLVEDTDTSDALPLLAFALNRLAEGLPRGGTLSAAAYEATGLRSILAEHADAAMAAACEAGALTEHHVMDALVRGMVSEDATGRRTRRRLARDTLSAALRTAIDQFVDRRLVISDGSSLRLAHDALIAEWPALASAVETRSTALRAAVLVGQAAADWDKAGRSDGYLWDARRYEAVIDDLGGPRRSEWKVEVDDLGPEFLAATRSAISRAALRRRRRLISTFSGLSALLAVSLVASVIAFIQARTAQQEREVAQAERDTALVRQLIARADAVRVSDTPLALRLGLAAEAIQPEPPAAAGLLRTLIVNNYASTIAAHDEPVFVTRFNPAGTLLASGDAYANKILLHDVRDLRHPTQVGNALSGHTHWVSGIDFTPDGETMVTSSTHETIAWDITTPERPRARWTMRAPEEYDVDAVGVAVSPDGTMLATMHGQAVALHDISEPDEPITVNPRIAGIVDYGDVAFSADGRFLAAGTNEGSYRASGGSVNGSAAVWRITDPAKPVKVADLRVPTGDVTGVDFSSTGRRLAVTSGGLLGDEGGMLALYEISDKGGAPIGAPVMDHTGGAWDVAFAPDSPHLTTTGLDGTIRTYIVDGGAVPFGDTMVDHRDYVYAVAYGPEGQMATGSADGTIIVWDERNPYVPAPGSPLTAPDTITELAVDSTGSVLAAGGSDGQVWAWNLAEPLVPRGPGEQAGDGSPVTALAFRPNSEIAVATTSSHGFYDLSDPLAPRAVAQRASPQRGDAIALWFSPDGTRMRVVDTNTSITEWDTSNPATPSVTATGLADREDTATDAAIRHDGRVFASKSKLDTSAAVLRDISDLAKVRLLDGILDDYTSGPITFDSTGHMVAAGGNDVLLWDVTTPSAPRRLGVPFGGPNTILAISPDNSMIAVAGTENRLTLWSIVDPDAPFLITAMTHAAPLTAITWFPDSATLASADDSGTIQVWSTRLITETHTHRHTAACDRARGGLDQTEWDRFVGTAHTHRPTCP